MLNHFSQYYDFDENAFTQIAETVAQKHYPHRIAPREWPNMKLIGKAMVRGWAIPCRYYTRPWMRGGYCRSFIYPGITDTEMKFIHTLMRQEEERKNPLRVEGVDVLQGK